MSRTKIQYISDVPPHDAIIEAVPGIGNVGKLVVDGLVASYDSKIIARILHPDMPPHATLDSEGLLRPPHLSIHSVSIGSQTVLCICSDAQPTTAAGQHEVAESILDFVKDYSDSRLYVLAGLAMDPEAQGIHVVCSEEGTRRSMEDHGIEVRTGQPESGMIGLAGLLVSLAPLHEVEAVGLVADTVGGATDARAAERLSMFVQDKFGLNIGMDLDRTQAIASRLLESVGISEAAIAEISGEHSYGDLYV